MKPYSLEVRLTKFWQRVDKTGNCWLWTGAQGPNGFGVTRWEDRNQYAHRVAYELIKGAIPDGLMVLHTCDNPTCCNPAHLFLGTRQDKTQKMVGHGRAYRPFGERNPKHKLTDAEIAEIRRRYDAGNVTQQALADEYGLHYSQVSLIVRGLRRLCR